MKRITIVAIAFLAFAFVGFGSTASASGPKPPKNDQNIVDCSGYSVPQSTSVMVTSDPVDPKKPLKVRTGRYASDENGVCQPLSLTIQPTSSLPEEVLPDNQSTPADPGSLMTTSSSTYFWSCDYTIQVDLGLGVKVFAGRVDQDYRYSSPYGVLVWWIKPYVDSWILTAGKLTNWQIQSESAPSVTVTKWVTYSPKYGPLQLTSPLKVVAAQEVPTPFGTITYNQTRLNLKAYSGPGYKCNYSVSTG